MSAVVDLTDKSEILLRQVHPKQLPQGSLSKVAFVPSKEDAGLLSTLREAVGPQEAFRRWTVDQQLLSVGTYGISVAAVVDDVNLRAIDDATPSIPDHASVDFTGLPTRGEVLKAGRVLRDLAAQRGCLYKPEATPSDQG